MAYTANPHYEQACALYKTHIQDRLNPRLRILTRELMGHPHRNPRYVRLSTWDRNQPPLAYFRLTFIDNLVEDILCTPDAMRQLDAGKAPLELLEEYAKSPTADLWTKDQASYVMAVVEAGRAAYQACVDTIQELGQHEVFALDCLQAVLTGAPVAKGARKLTFTVQFSAQAPQGWFQCPSCASQIPDLPTARGPDGQPVCFNVECALGVKLPADAE